MVGIGLWRPCIPVLVTSKEPRAEALRGKKDYVPSRLSWEG